MSQLLGSLLNGTKGLILWLDEGFFRWVCPWQGSCVSHRSSSRILALILWEDRIDDVMMMMMVDGRIRGQQ